METGERRVGANAMADCRNVTAGRMEQAAFEPSDTRNFELMEMSGRDGDCVWA